MAASRPLPRPRADCHICTVPDQRLVVASALTALTVLLLMLIAGTAS